MAKNKVKWKIEIIVLECLLIAALLAIVFVKKVETYEFDSEATYFVSATDYPIESGAKAIFDEETKKVYIKNGDEKEEDLSSVPVYYNDQDKFVLLKDMAFIQTDLLYYNGYYLPYFTECYFNDDYTITLEKGTSLSTVKNAFLYDGDDTYVFLDDVYVDFSSGSVSLPRFSWITVLNGNSLIYYNYDEKLTYFIEESDTVTCKELSGYYSINLSNDILSYGDKDAMLYGYVKMYSLYFEDAEE